MNNEFAIIVFLLKIHFYEKERPLFIGWGNEDELIRRMKAENFKVYPLCWQTPTLTQETTQDENKTISCFPSTT